jgi:dipeptidase E
MKQLLLLSTSAVHGTQYLEHAFAELKEFLGSRRRVLFIPYALKNQDRYAAKARAAFESIGYEVDSLHEAPSAKAAVLDAEAIFCGGGNTFRLLNHLYLHELVPVIRARVKEGGLRYAGASAGANVACPTIRTTNDMPIIQPPSFEALCLVPFQINPHYLDPDPASTHMGETRETRLREFLEENDEPVVGLREGAMLRVEGDHVSLRGAAGARVFLKGRDPVEVSPGASLDETLR